MENLLSVQRKVGGITLKDFGKDKFVGWSKHMIASWFEILS
jgi:hypothetical protein